MKYVWFLSLMILSVLQTRGQSANASPEFLLKQLKSSQADTNRVKLLLDLSLYYTLKPGELEADLDTALLLSQQAELLSRAIHYDIGEGDSYLTTAKALGEKDQKQKGKLAAYKAINIFIRLKAFSKLADVYRELSHYCLLSKGELPQKIDFNEQALKLVRQIKDRKSEADILIELADFHQILGNYTLSIAELRQAQVIYQAIHYNDLVSIYDLLGFVSTKLGDFQEGLKYGLLAAQIVDRDNEKSLKNTLIACTVYNRVGITYFVMGQFKQAAMYYEKSFLIAKKSNYNPSIIHLAGNLSTVYLSLNRPNKALALLKSVKETYPPTLDGSRLHLSTRFIDVYRELKNYTLSQQYCNEVLKLSKKIGWENIGQSGVYQSLIQFFIDSGQYGKAAAYLSDNEKFCLKNSSLTGLVTNHLLWFQLDSTQAKFTQAITHYQQAMSLRNSLLNETKSKYIAQLEVQYNTQKKDYDLWLKGKNINYLTNQSQLQQSQLQQARTVRNSIIAGAVLLAGLLGLSYNRYRLKQRGNQLLKAQQIEINQKNNSLEQNNQLLETKQVEINQKNQSLQQVLTEKEHLLAEKERLLKEIHHRVKNNLQIVMSLLNAQAASLKDQTALSAIQQSQHRVQAMALIHQKLYQAEGLARINMAEYIAEVIAYLHESYELPQSIRFDLQVEPIELDITQAVPLGLIINEAVTNALKYAFPAGRSGTVHIGLQEMGEGEYELVIADDGVGLPADYDPSQSRSLGMTLMYGFSEQLGGQLLISGQSGLAIRLLYHDETLTVNS